jgi:hypothetical protein
MGRPREPAGPSALPLRPPRQDLIARPQSTSSPRKPNTVTGTDAAPTQLRRAGGRHGAAGSSQLSKDDRLAVSRDSSLASAQPACMAAPSVSADRGPASDVLRRELPTPTTIGSCTPITSPHTKQTICPCNTQEGGPASRISKSVIDRTLAAHFTESTLATLVRQKPIRIDQSAGSCFWWVSGLRGRPKIGRACARVCDRLRALPVPRWCGGRTLVATRNEGGQLALPR